MSGARYSLHLHAEEAAGSLEALIRDYESRGRRLRACQQALLQAMINTLTSPSSSKRRSSRAASEVSTWRLSTPTRALAWPA